MKTIQYINAIASETMKMYRAFVIKNPSANC